MGKVMMTIRAPQAPSLDEIRRSFGLAEGDLDHAFGVIEIDPVDHLFAFMVDADKTHNMQGSNAPGSSAPPVAGPYSNPKISTFGPPQD